METKDLARILGIVIVIVMALSMFGAFLYVERTPGQDTTVDPNSLPPQAQSQTFNYSLSFDSNAVKELSSIKAALSTSSLDKSAIDAAVLKISGVSNVSSQFKKTQTNSTEWIYLADITLKNGTDISKVLLGMVDTNLFNSSIQPEAMKRMTISVPPSVLLHNVDLNVDRNFSFTTTTLPALVALATTPGDKLVIGGTVTLQGQAINALELYELQNLTKQPQIDLNTPIDLNIPVDANAPKTDLNK